ncbi:MAG: hypothetical protein WA324_29600 [Bryobacteraceae bacterium]
MRFALILAFAAALVAGQSPVAQISNISRPGANGFQMGDRFQIAVTGAPDQPVSVRTIDNGRTDWGPVIGQTDSNGHWSTQGQFRDGDFGSIAEVWSVGSRATPLIRISIEASCLKDGRTSVAYLGAAMAETCETVDGRKSFSTPSEVDSFRTPDGREVRGVAPVHMTAEQYDMRRLESLLSTAPDNLSQQSLSPRLYGDQAAAMIEKLIGVNGLSDEETENVVRIVHAAFERSDRIPRQAHDPSATLLLLRRLANAAQQASLKKEIAETINSVQLQ